MADLVAEHEPYAAELEAAVLAALRDGRYILGPDVAAFETEAAGYLGNSFAVGCNSGTDALVLALRALGIGPGDEVVTSPFTFFATAEAISSVGAVPVFADIDPDTYNIDADAVVAAISSQTRALLPVHLYGQPADLGRLRRIAADHGLVMVEDSAQAFGARYEGRCVGTLGECGAFSFFPSKPLGGLGDGGLVTTDDPDVAARLRMLRVHGTRRKYENELIGYNSRLDTLQAAALRVKLRRVDAAADARRRVAARYDERLGGLDGVRVPVKPPGADHVYHQYTIRIEDGRRDDVQKHLTAAGIASMIYYPVPLHRLPVYRGSGPFPRAEAAAEEVLSLPISAGLDLASVDEVADAVTAALDT